MPVRSLLEVLFNPFHREVHKCLPRQQLCLTRAHRSDAGFARVQEIQEDLGEIVAVLPIRDSFAVFQTLNPLFATVRPYVAPASASTGRGRGTDPG